MTVWAVIGDLTSTFTGGTPERSAPQLKQNRASSALDLPHAWHSGIEQTRYQMVKRRF
jgi:phospholipase C